ncbi:MAG: dNTP triphosphohydrolase [Muribaculaceae bacterium]|nr:dNTP triphosphohydrolase [Muribaculaceae bacterium]
MHWNQLINDKRFGLEDYHDPKKGHIRTDFRRDYDRLVFSSPFRRLQNKTQVFPLPGSIFVHNRLTHSLEVACVGKSLADTVGAALSEKYDTEPWKGVFYDLGDIVASACLAHDLGNPPFGHSGEKAISSFFSEGGGRDVKQLLTPSQWLDLTCFEGNANAFRLLTHQFHGRREGGFAMTYSMLASIVKYPYDSSHAGEHGKFGFFTTEADSYLRIARTLGLRQFPQTDGSLVFARHPLVYIVEAADDICYEVMDIEDAHKLRILSSIEVIDLLIDFFDMARRERIHQVMSRFSDPNEKIAYLRSCVIGDLVQCCADVFIANEQTILDGTFSGTLLDNVPPRQNVAFQRCRAMSWNRIYCSSDVVDIEIAGNQILTFLLEKLIHAVIHPDLTYSRLLLSQVPQQYDVHSPDIFLRIQAVVDHISSMTDVYALNLYRKLNGHTLPAV